MTTILFDTAVYSHTALLATVREFRGTTEMLLKKKESTDFFEISYEETPTSPSEAAIRQSADDNVLREKLDKNFKGMREQIVKCAFSAIQSK